MKALVQTILFILMSYVLYGQDLTGKWNGTLSVQGNQIRIVFDVSKVNDQYEVTMDSPDQNANGIKVTAVKFDYPNVKFEVESIGAVYEGVMTNENVTGKWVQSGTALFLVLLRESNLPRNKER